MPVNTYLAIPKFAGTGSESPEIRFKFAGDGADPARSGSGSLNLEDNFSVRWRIKRSGINACDLILPEQPGTLPLGIADFLPRLLPSISCPFFGHSLAECLRPPSANSLNPLPVTTLVPPETRRQIMVSQPFNLSSASKSTAPGRIHTFASRHWTSRRGQ